MQTRHMQFLMVAHRSPPLRTENNAGLACAAGPAAAFNTGDHRIGSRRSCCQSIKRLIRINRLAFRIGEHGAERFRQQAGPDRRGPTPDCLCNATADRQDRQRDHDQDLRLPAVGAGPAAGRLPVAPDFPGAGHPRRRGPVTRAPGPRTRPGQSLRAGHAYRQSRMDA
jgi:hypothetical protein